MTSPAGWTIHGKSEEERDEYDEIAAELHAADSENRDPDFHGCDFWCNSIRGYHLVNANFSDSDLRDVDLTSSLLDGADFRGADLDGAVVPSEALLDCFINQATTLPARVRQDLLAAPLLPLFDALMEDWDGTLRDAIRTVKLLHAA